MVGCFGLADIRNSGNSLHVLPPNGDYKYDWGALSSGNFPFLASLSGG
jgi:hypothetical protein